MTKSKPSLILCDKDKLLQEEKERLRKLRILQVREISKQEAARLRGAFQREKQRGVQSLVSKKESARAEEMGADLAQLASAVQTQIEHIGESHMFAENVNESAESVEERRARLAAENELRANYRGRQALMVAHEERQATANKENAHVIARRYALEQEKLRASQVASLPRRKTPPAPTTTTTKDAKSAPAGKMVSLHDANTFMTTRYHMPEAIVDRSEVEATAQEDARREAEEEEVRLGLVRDDLARRHQEQLEKARLRGKHALEKELIAESYADVMGKLEHLQKLDREKHQKELLAIPKEIFLPGWQREQAKKEHQLELERRFESIYNSAEMRAEPMPEPADSRASEAGEMGESALLGDADLDLTLVDEPAAEPEAPAEVQAPIQAPQKPQAPSTTSGAANPLSKLMDKIRRQREELSTKTTAPGDLDASTASEEATLRPDAIGGDLSVDKSATASANTTTATVEDEEDECAAATPGQMKLASEDEEDSVDSLVTETGLEAAEKAAPSVRRHQRLVKRMMMSSHNVSSVHELGRLGAPASETATTTAGLDLSLVSRDPMVAGPRELLTSRDIKLVLEGRDELLRRRQLELEQRLRELELRESAIDAAAAAAVVTSKRQEAAATDSGNDHNYQSDSAAASPQLTKRSSAGSSTTTTTSRRPVREFQDLLLTRQTATKAGEASGYSSASSDSFWPDSARLIEQKKLEILRRSGLDRLLVEKSKGPGSVDSGFAASSLTAPPVQSQSISAPQKQKETDTGAADASNLFGLEFFDSQNLSDVRDASIEKLIGLAARTRLNMMNASSSSNDTLKDGDDETFARLNCEPTPSETETEEEEEETAEESSHAIAALLGRATASGPSRNELKAAEIRRQLEQVRRQKEKLLQMQQQQQQLVSTAPRRQATTPEKTAHELSTIKEVDTPMSEKNFRPPAPVRPAGAPRVQQQHQNDLSTINSMAADEWASDEASLSMAKSGAPAGVLLDSSAVSTSSTTTTTSTPLSTRGGDLVTPLLSQATIRQRQAALLNFSLFNSSASAIEASPPSSKIQERPTLDVRALIQRSLEELTQVTTLRAPDAKLAASSTTTFNAGGVDTTLVEEQHSWKAASSTMISQAESLASNSQASRPGGAGKKWFDILMMNESDSDEMVTLKSASVSGHSVGSNAADYHDEEEPTTDGCSELTQYPIAPEMMMTTQAADKEEEEVAQNFGSLFDKFLKNYSNTQSVLDEPEISFVSYRTASNPPSPSRLSSAQQQFTTTMASASQLQTSQSCCRSMSGYTMATMTTSEETTTTTTTSATTTATTTSSASSTSMGSSTICQIQQEQLVEHFANMSPILDGILARK